MRTVLEHRMIFRATTVGTQHRSYDQRSARHRLQKLCLKELRAGEVEENLAFAQVCGQLKRRPLLHETTDVFELCLPNKNRRMFELTEGFHVLEGFLAKLANMD